jgi:signal transduction histidine kinase
VVHDSVRDSGWPLGQVAEPSERFAALFRSQRAAILACYAKRLEALRSPVIADPRVSGPAMANASQILADVMTILQGGRAAIDDRYQMLPWMTSSGGAASQLSPADLLRAAVAFFEVTVDSLAGHVQGDPELIPWFAKAVVALNEGISVRIREATLAYTGYLLERVDHAHLDERRRIARDLHDRLGEGMSAALRQIELHELANGEDQPARGRRATRAKEAIAEAMRRLRVVISDLRHEPVRSLERALIEYIDSVAADADVRLRVSGDETWAPPSVVDEAFLILREAIRNALRHGRPRMVLIGVALAPHELRAWVEDDGCGFVPASSPDPVSTGTGLASMRERAALMGGRLAVTSIPGQGTRVELLVPLPGRDDG